MHCLGFLPSFLSIEDRTPWDDQLAQGYGYPLDWGSRATVTADGVYSYPGDPDLHPVAVTERNVGPVTERLYFYEYGFVAYALISDEVTAIKTTRMD